MIAIPYQKPGAAESVGPTEDRRTVAWTVSPDGRRYRGAEATNAALSAAFRSWLPQAFYRLPMIGPLQDRLCFWIAANRRRLLGDVAHCSQRPQDCGQSHGTAERNGPDGRIAAGAPVTAAPPARTARAPPVITRDSRYLCRLGECLPGRDWRPGVRTLAKTVTGWRGRQTDNDRRLIERESMRRTIFVVATMVTVLVLTAGAAAAATYVGTDGPDTIRGSLGNDVIRGLGGDDRLSGSLGRARVFGGPGNDRVDVGDDRQADVVGCGPGLDTVATRSLLPNRDVYKNCEVYFPA